MAYWVRWLGQGGFELSDGRSAMLLDPYLSDLVEKVEGLKRLVPPPILPRDAHPGLYLITHEHIDHLDADTIAAMPKAGVTFAAPGGCRAKLLELGVGEKSIIRLDRGMRTAFKGFEIEAVYARHTADSIGLVIRQGGTVAYFSGDTELDDEVGRGIVCDALFVCINGRWGNMGIEDALKLSLRVQAKLSFPNHYGMFAENTTDPEPFVHRLQALGKNGYIMKHAQNIDLAELKRSAENASSNL
jgi:L-ascorbate 6-phosphate lactonase